MKECFNFESGKYKVIRYEDYSIEIYRNNERWFVMEDQMKYCKFFHSMLNELKSE